MKVNAESVLEQGNVPRYCVFCESYKECSMMDWYDDHLNPKNINNATCNGFKNKIIAFIINMVAFALVFGFIASCQFWAKIIVGGLCYILYQIALVFNNKED